MQLDHVTIRTRDIAGTREFFRAVFGLEVGHRPAAVHRIPGCWMYAEGQALVHLIGSQGHGVDRAAEAIDHVGFRLTGYAEFRAKLDRLGLRYSTMDLADLQERRLFLRAPGGPLLEAVFAEPIPKETVDALQR